MLKPRSADTVVASSAVEACCGEKQTTAETGDESRPPPAGSGQDLGRHSVLAKPVPGTVSVKTPSTGRTTSVDMDTSVSIFTSSQTKSDTHTSQVGSPSTPSMKRMVPDLQKVPKATGTLNVDEAENLETQTGAGLNPEPSWAEQTEQHLNEVDAMEEEQINQVDAWNEDLTNSTAFLRSTGTNFQYMAQQELAEIIEKENPVTAPSFLMRSGPNNYKLIWDNNSMREKALSGKLYINGIQLMLEKPFRETRGTRVAGPRPPAIRTVHMHGIPLIAPKPFVEKWIQEVTKATLKQDTGVMFVKYQGTEIKSASRSAVLVVPSGQPIPGYADMKIPGGRTLRIRITYRYSPKWCRNCYEQGHTSYECPKNQAPPPDRESSAEYPNLAQRKISTMSQSSETISPSSTSSTKTVIAAAPVQRDTGLDEKYKNNFEGFFTKKFVFSNHYPAKITIDTKAYESTEHFLFSEKAREAKDAIAFAQIRKDKNDPGKIKRTGSQIKYPKGEDNWKTMAYNHLLKANRAKYEQHDEMRKSLFKTAGKRLVETSFDKYWGCGHKLEDEAKWDELSKWTGANKFGDMLTILRDTMMEDPQYKEEVESLFRTKKRSLEEDENTTQPKQLLRDQKKVV